MFIVGMLPAVKCLTYHSHCMKRSQNVHFMGPLCEDCIFHGPIVCNCARSPHLSQSDVPLRSCIKHISNPYVHSRAASIVACVLPGVGEKWMTGHRVQLVLSHPSQTTMDACHLSWLLSLAQQSRLCHKQPANLMQVLWRLQCIQQTPIKLLITLSRQQLPLKLCHSKLHGPQVWWMSLKSINCKVTLLCVTIIGSVSKT